MKQVLIVTLMFLLSSCNLLKQKENARKIDTLLKLAAASDSVMDLKTSVKHYSEVLEIDSTNLVALNNRGRALVWLSEIDKGFTDFNKAIKLYPGYLTYFKRGLLYIRTGQYGKAKADFLKSINYNSKFGDPHYGLSLVYLDAGDFETAYTHCQIADQLGYNPDYSHEIRFKVHQQKGEFKAAIEEATSTIEANPSSLNYNNRGFAKLMAKQYEQSLLDFDKAISLDSMMSFAYNNKGAALLKLKQPKEALKYVNKALSIANDNAYAFKNRAEIFIALSKPTNACADLATAENISTESALTQEIKDLRKTSCK